MSGLYGIPPLMPPRRDNTNGPQSNGEEGKDRKERMEATLNRVAGTLGTLVQVVGTQLEGRVDLEKFLKVVGRKEFKGTEEPLEAERWLMGIHKEFIALHVEENDKAEFETLFLEKYFTEIAKAQMCAEFATLTQGDMTDALKLAIHARLVPRRLTTYNDVLDTALDVEADWNKNQIKREPRDQKRSQKRQRIDDIERNEKRRHIDDIGKIVEPKGLSLRLPAKPYANYVCHRCGSSDHFIKDCPTP
ncbi:hypothetical protein C5167_020957 [Papaver somniferum]|uniref:CCHC-type domain-containing protein n=1 Tax=Papaver somniferum TaxID=3469 RepID=A0A4Y7IUG9_PAPSO|nr:hypothetical protein C5167_020957 [Papaver somniferum]